jgi:hypothetical protein
MDYKRLMASESIRDALCWLATDQVEKNAALELYERAAKSNDPLRMMAEALSERLQSA